MSEYDIIPDHILDAINSYVKRGQYPGKFIESVASNKLFDSISYADEDCLKALSKIVIYFYNKTPGSCWGGRNKVKDWLRHGGAECDDVSYELNLIERDHGKN